MRNRGLKCLKAVVERQEQLPKGGHAHRLLLRAVNAGAHLLRLHPCVLHSGALAPFADRLLVEPTTFGQLGDRSLRSLYRGSDCVRGRGARLQNLDHSASRSPLDGRLPPHQGTENGAALHDIEEDHLIDQQLPFVFPESATLSGSRWIATLIEIPYDSRSPTFWDRQQTAGRHIALGDLIPPTLSGSIIVGHKP